MGLEPEARQAWNRALEIDPAMGRFVHRRVGEAEDSVQMLRSLLQADPINTALRLQLAEQLQRQGSGAEAVEEIQEVLRRLAAGAGGLEVAGEDPHRPGGLPPGGGGAAPGARPAARRRRAGDPVRRGCW